MGLLMGSLAKTAILVSGNVVRGDEGRFDWMPMLPDDVMLYHCMVFLQYAILFYV